MAFSKCSGKFYPARVRANVCFCLCCFVFVGFAAIFIFRSMSAAAISCVQIIHIIAANQIQKQTNEQASKQTKSVATFDSFKENNKRSRLNNLVHVKCITLKMGKTPNDYHYLSGEITAFCIHKLNAFFQNPFSLRQHSLFACLSVVHSFGCVVMLVVNLIERKHLASSSISQNVHAHIPK